MEGGEMSEAPATPVNSRRRPKARKELQKLAGQIDTLFAALADKPAKQADLLIEKSAIIKALIALEVGELDAELKAVQAENEQLKTEITALKPVTAPPKNNPVVAAMLEQARARYDRPGLRETPQTASQEVPAPTPAHSSHEAPKPAHNDLILMRGPYVAKTDTPKHAEAPAFIPDFRTGEEKLLEAKRLTTGRL
jgi:hypothetical protein